MGTPLDRSSLDYEALWKLAMEQAEREAMLDWPNGQANRREVEVRAMIYYRQMTRP